MIICHSILLHQLQSCRKPMKHVYRVIVYHHHTPFDILTCIYPPKYSFSSHFAYNNRQVVCSSLSVVGCWEKVGDRDAAEEIPQLEFRLMRWYRDLHPALIPADSSERIYSKNGLLIIIWYWFGRRGSINYRIHMKNVRMYYIMYVCLSLDFDIKSNYQTRVKG